MKHKGTVTLETERLILRKFKESDVEPAFGNWMSHDSVTKYLTWQTHGDISDTREVIGSWIAQNDDPARYMWAIELKEVGEAIGSVSVVSMDEAVNSVEIGYCIGEKWWHKGIVSEAVSALIGFFFTEVGVNRIAAYHDARNPNSGKVMQKCGMKYEGTFRQARFNNSGLADVCFYSILAEEYDNQPR